MESKTVTLVLSKETKGTYRYEEQVSGNQAPVVGTLYVKKYAFARPVRTLELTLTAKE